MYASLDQRAFKCNVFFPIIQFLFTLCSIPYISTFLSTLTTHWQISRVDESLLLLKIFFRIRHLRTSWDKSNIAREASSEGFSVDYSQEKKLKAKTNPADEWYGTRQGKRWVLEKNTILLVREKEWVSISFCFLVFKKIPPNLSIRWRSSLPDVSVLLAFSAYFT